ncbi:MAG: dihydrolipoamide acetyltransferase family protein [Dehalococcoidia bacterium]
MPVTIQLPQVGESVTEGVIGRWLKQVGDTVEKYDPLVEVMTDKVNMEVPSPFNGTLTAVLVKEGDTVPMGAPIAEMETEEAIEEPAAPPTPPPGPAQAPPSPGRTGVLLKDVRPVGPTGAGEEPPIPVDIAPAAQPPAPAPTRPSVGEAEASRRRYSPVVRRLAAERGIDLALVPGTGIEGRVTKEDVLRYGEQAPAVPVAAEPGGPDEEVVPLTPLRRLIADNMVRSATQIPQAWSYVEVDVTSLVARRESVKVDFLQREGVDLTYLPFFMKAVVEALKEHPLLNSTWGGDKIIIKKRINVGIAVAMAQGLIVPVVHDADTMSIAGLAKACRNLIQRAHDGKLTLDEVQGGTFTLNNTGALGSVASQPLVNPPQAAIMTTEAIIKRAVVLPGDAIAVRSIVNVCMSFDHRILDGAESGAFMATVKRHLEAMGPDTPIY